MPELNVHGFVLALASALALGGCSMIEPEPLEPPVVNLRGLEPEAMGINSQVFRARLSLFNPNTVALQVSRGEVQLRLGGVHAAKGRTLEPFSVPSGEAVEVDIRVTTNLLRDGPSLLGALSGGAAGEGLQYELTGYVNVARRGPDRVPIRANGMLSPPAGRPATPHKAPPPPGSIL